MVDVLRVLEERKFHNCHNVKGSLSSYLTNKLTLETELTKHDGCVNCLQWSTTGERLLSGSDDLAVCVWEPFSRQPLLTSIPSGHGHNIFSVKFINSEQQVISGSGDGAVHHLDIEEREVLSKWMCHSKRVKRCCTVADSEYLAISSSEDGTVRQIDIRQGHVCPADRGEQDCSNTIITLENQSIKCINSNPAQPHLLCVGADDPVTRVYDRRMLSPAQDEESTEPAFKFVPGHLLYQKRYYGYLSPSVTWCTFDDTGRYLLCNMGVEQVYLYEISGESTVINLPTLTGEELPPTNCNSTQCKCSSSQCKSRPLDSATKILKERGNTFFKMKEFDKAVVIYSQCIDRYPDNAILLNNRAIALLKRGWRGDKYAAFRDSISALQIDPRNTKAHLRQIQSLHEMDFNKIAWTKISVFLAHHGRPSDPSFDSLSQKIDQALESGLKEPSVTPPSLLDAVDYSSRYIGHCNVKTDIKEANFFGPQQEYIVAGSDDERIFLWHRSSETLRAVYTADSMLVNCVQPHPTQPILASSGLDSVVKLWSPHHSPIHEGTLPITRLHDLSDIAEKNQSLMSDWFPMPFMGLDYSRLAAEEGGGGPLACNPS